jgi:hypothetical protein
VGVSLGLALTLSACVSGSAAAGTLAPASDPFYTYTGALQNVAPGSVLKMRAVRIALTGAVPALSATQVLYRTQDQLGQPTATVATIIRPLAPLGPTKLVSYQTFYDGVASTCRPSYRRPQASA